MPGPTRTGTTELWLVSGGVPHYKEMVKLSGSIISALVNEFGTGEVIKRFSNPCWFSCLASALGFEWNTSGQTTVTLSALKQAVNRENLGIKFLGGKGKFGRSVPRELPEVGDKLGLSEKKIQKTSYASKISAKVDSSALQDLKGPIYCHSLILDEKGDWGVIQQKMSPEDQKARRYHWLSGIENFVEEPHSGIIGNRQEIVLDLTSHKSEAARETITDLVKESPEALKKELSSLSQKTIPYQNLPKRLNEKAIREAGEAGAKNFQQVLEVKGMGPATVRGLAYISALIYGAELSWKDPSRYEWAFGTKTGRPYYVQKKEMTKSAEVLKLAVQEAKLGQRDKLRAIQRLNRFLKY